MTEDMRLLRGAEEIRTLYVHDMAADTLKAMFARCDEVLAEHGPEKYVAAVRSLHHCLANLLRKGFGDEAFVTKFTDSNEGGGLFVKESGGLVFGINWSRASLTWSCNS